MLTLRNLLNVIKIVLEGKGQYMGQISSNKPFITTMADDLKQTEPPKGQTVPTPPIKPADNNLKNKLADAPRIIPKTITPAVAPIKKPIVPLFSTPSKPAVAPRPISPKPIAPLQQKPDIPPQPIIPPKPIAQSFSAPPKPAIKLDLAPQPKEKPIAAATPSINIPKPELPKQKISPSIPDKILIEPNITKPHGNKILIIATIAIIIISGVSGYYYWPTDLPPEEPGTIEKENSVEFDPANIPKRKLIKLIDNNDIYYVTEVGAKRLIPSEEILNSYPLNKYEAITTVSQEEFDYYPENIFIKLPDDPKIYKLENGQKRWLKNEDASKNPDFDWNEVAPVNQTEFDFYPEGTPIE